MKKILKGPSVFRAKCTVCDTEFQYQSEDLLRLNLGSLYVQCPNCGNSVKHEPSVKTKTIIPQTSTEYM